MNYCEGFKLLVLLRCLLEYIQALIELAQKINFVLLLTTVAKAEEKFNGEEKAQSFPVQKFYGKLIIKSWDSLRKSWGAFRTCRFVSTSHEQV